jgi:hypothetical protein
MLGDLGTRVSQLIYNDATADGVNVNPQVLLATLQKEYGVALKKNWPSNDALDEAMRCDGKTDFATQITCGANTFNTNFTGYPVGDDAYLFPVNGAGKSKYPSGRVTKSIQYSWTAPPAVCNATQHTDCDLVGFSMENAATYAQYKYTPFIQTSVDGGCVYSFEYWWLEFTNEAWQ